MGIHLAFASLLWVAGFGLGCQRPEIAPDAGADENSPSSAPSTSGQPSFMPAFSTTLYLRAGEVKSVPPGASGPVTLRVMVNAKDRVSFGLVRKSDLSKYSSPKQVEAAMESLPCASAGAGNMSRGCELGDTDKDFILMVADLRDSAQATRDLFDTKKKPDAAAGYFNSVEVSIYIALPPGK